MRRERLIAARKSAGKSQEQVGAEVGADRTTIGTWERGERTPQPNQRPAYAEALGVTLEELAAMLSSVPPGVGETPDWLVNYLASEQSAIELRAHEPRAVYGLFQAPAYCPGRLFRQEILADREFSRWSRVRPVLSTNIGGTPWHVADDRPSRSS